MNNLRVIFIVLGLFNLCSSEQTKQQETNNETPVAFTEEGFPVYERNVIDPQKDSAEVFFQKLLNNKVPDRFSQRTCEKETQEVVDYYVEKGKKLAEDMGLQYLGRK